MSEDNEGTSDSRSSVISRNERIGEESLPLYSEDGGIAEAIRRSEEMKANPELGMTAEQLHEKLVERFPFLNRRSSDLV
jgi:hypothetical protein